LEISGIPICQNDGISVGRYSTCPEGPRRLHPGSFSCSCALDHPGEKGCVPRYSGALVARSMSQKPGSLAISNKRWFARPPPPAARSPRWVFKIGGKQRSTRELKDARTTPARRARVGGYRYSLPSSTPSCFPSCGYEVRVGAAAQTGNSFDELRRSPILGSSCASSCVQALRGGGGRGGAQASHHASAQADGVRARVWRAAGSLNRPRAAGGLTYRRQSSAVGVSRPQRADSSLRRIAGGAPRVDPRIRHRPA
jgi:hypothetical protein